jgi:hypothetical protein
MQQIVDELGATGCSVTTREHVSFILAGLGFEYNALVAAPWVATTPISLSHLYATLQAYDQRQEVLNGSLDPKFVSSANIASRQRRGRSNNNRYCGDRSDSHDDRHDDCFL